MLVSELRIGNLVVAPETPFDIVKVNIDCLNYYMNDLIPIQLTEEWLLKFGFVKSDVYFLLENSSFFIGVTLENVVYPFFDTSMGLLVDLKYVHQLQNLYFALTGKELEY